MVVIFGTTTADFDDYNFPCASVYPIGTVSASAIRDADPTEHPPELRTKQGTLFVPSLQKRDLEDFCHRNDIALLGRRPIWPDLLEPFVDTVFPAEMRRATAARLEGAGFPPAMVDEFRSRLAALMVAYNIDSGLWDWCELSQYDALNAASGVLVPADLPPTLGDPAAFYAWTMRVADGHADPWPGQVTPRPGP